MEELNFEKTKRAERKQNQVSKETESSYSDYNWRELVESDKLRQKTRKVLEKYISYHNLGTCRYKKDMIDAIIAHFCTGGPMANQVNKP